MNSRLIRITVACTLLVFLSSALSARAETMKLLTPEVGWVLHGCGLMWTTDGGAYWKNITPPPARPPAGAITANEHIVSVFFLDTLNGWALLSGPQKDSEEPKFDLAATTDAGSSWSIASVIVPAIPPGQAVLAGSGQADFIDSLHGWLNLDMVSSSNFRSALLIETEDGGRSWTRPPNSPGVGGDLKFTSANDGWLAGGPGGERLYVTHDGSQTWQRVSLSPPLDMGGATYPVFPEAPVFEDSESGFLPVNYSGPEGTPSKLVVYSTDDGGRTWEPIKIISESTESGSASFPVDIIDSVLVMSTSPSLNSIKTAEVPLSGESHRATAALSPVGAVMALSFANSTTGWAIAEYERSLPVLLSTSDGGNTWTDITPHIGYKPFPQVSPNARPPRRVRRQLHQ